MLKSKGPKGHAGGLFGASDGKGAASQTGFFGQKSTLTAGDPMSRMMGQHGKGHSYLQPGVGGSAPMEPTSPSHAHPGISEIRGSGTAIKRNPRAGSLRGKESMPSTAMSD